MLIGFDELMSDLENIIDVDIKKATDKAIHLVQESAKANVLVDSGELRESIYTKVESDEDGYIGRCGTNKAYATYVEFGTGPKGQANHEGISPDVAVAYTQSPWWIHESQIDEATAEKYHWFHIDTPDGRFYNCSGQSAHPYLYPALNDQREEISEVFADAIQEALK